jgi:hypothetical protein
MPPAATEAVDQVASPSLAVNAESLFKAIQQFGLPLVMLGVILWWARHDLVQPLLDAHFQVVEKIVVGQQDHAEKLDRIGDSLEELIRISK